MFAGRFVAPYPVTLLLVLGLWALCGCGGSASSNLGPQSTPDATTGSGACVSGQQSACACPGSATVGAQICNTDGHSFGPCMGCGANDAQPFMEDDAPNDGGATRDAAAREAASPEAGGSSCAPPDGGLPCDPGHVSCGGSPCPTSTSFCCETSTGASATCDQTGTTCTQSEVHCDESADCDGGVCCMSIAVSFVTTVKSTCQATCATGTYQLCRSSTECGTGQSCIPQTCLAGSDTEACTTVPGCTAK
jgi:hypothetical protein